MTSTLWLSCGVLRAELQELLASHQIAGELVFLNSMLHMDPRKLDSVLNGYLSKPCSVSRPVVLVYGDCCPSMIEIVRRHKIHRVDSINCAQMLLGRARYRELMQQEAFLFLPEWALRWREIIEINLGLSKEIAQELMGENRRELVYLDTGLVPIPSMEECVDFLNLPFRVEKVGLNHLASSLLQAEKSARLDAQL